AADAEVDHVADWRAGVPAPGAAAYRLAERTHLRAHGQDLRHDVDAVDHQRPGLGSAPEGGVQHRPVLAQVDPFTAQHCVAQRLDAARAGQGGEKGERVAGDAVLRVVQQQAVDFEGESLEPGPVDGEQVAHV